MFANVGGNNTPITTACHAEFRRKFSAGMQKTYIWGGAKTEKKISQSNEKGVRYFSA